MESASRGLTVRELRTSPAIITVIGINQTHILFHFGTNQTPNPENFPLYENTLPHKSQHGFLHDSLKNIFFLVNDGTTKRKKHSVLNIPGRHLIYNNLY